MNHERKIDEAHLWHIEYPFFADEKNLRMNKYFESLTNAVKDLCKGESFPKNVRYYMTYDFINKEESTEINVTLSLRRRGRTVKRRKIHTEWKNGFIINKEVKDVL